MSLLGIDVGTTGCKALAFAEDDGQVRGAAYREYDVQRPHPGWAELDVFEVWDKVKECVREVVSSTRRDPVRAVAVSSLGEAVVPVSEDRRILGSSILNFDERGAEYQDGLGRALDSERLYAINGNILGNHYSLTKLLWIREHRPDLYAQAYRFLHWSGFVSFMLGADPVVDFSLANRTLLFDVNAETWSDEIVAAAGLDPDKLPAPVPSGRIVGEVSGSVAEELGLSHGTPIGAGAHDQCANALGSGVTCEGRAMLGMGTYLCLMPVYRRRPPTDVMMARGLNTEHHAVPGLFGSFIYNQGGALLKWYRDTFAQAEHRVAQGEGRDVYAELLAEMPQNPSRVVVLPHFTVTGPPEFVADSCGVIAGLKLDTSRGEIVKGILEGAVFYLRECVETLPATGIAVESVRAVGGGSKSDAWVQLCADILGRPFVRPTQTEAGALGAALLAGTGAGVYASMAEGAEQLVRLDREFEPDPRRHAEYASHFEHYRRLWPAVRNYVSALTATPTPV